MPSADGQQREFAMLIDAFEACTSPPDESGQFVDLLADFQEIADAGRLARDGDLSLGDAQDLLGSFQDLWQPYLEGNAEAAPSANIWKVANLGLDEVRHCRVLKWLLDPNESHCQGVRFLRCLFEAMGEEWTDEPDTISVRREVLSEGDSRFDIVIESRSFFACIEAKIQAPESKEQLVRYLDRVTKQTRGRRFIGRLLTVDRVSREPLVEGFTRLFWSDVARALRRFAGRERDSDPLAARSQFIRDLSFQYADFIASHLWAEGV
jgi:hypothetical protein